MESVVSKAGDCRQILLTEAVGTVIPSPGDSVGKPTKLEICNQRSGQPVESIRVRLLDEHGSVCDNISGLHFRADLFAIGAPSFKEDGTDASHLVSLYAVMISGKAAFKNIQWKLCKEGLYSVKVSAVEGGFWATSEPLATAEVQLAVKYGIMSEIILEHFKQMSQISKTLRFPVHLHSLARTEIGNRTREKEALETDLLRLKEKLKLLEQQVCTVNEERIAAGDSEILAQASRLPSMTEDLIVQNMRHVAKDGHAAPLAIWEAQRMKSFLSPSRGNAGAAHDILGLVIMLARVECELLSSVLSEYLGSSNLLALACRTEKGVKSLTTYDKDGNLDEDYGLQGFAVSRNYKITKAYKILCLQYLSPYKRSDGKPSVDMKHHQRLLNIDPPYLENGQCPPGFLGYAVNFLHIRDEHLKVNKDLEGAGLRQSLFSGLLGTLQVYDTRQHMEEASAKLEADYELLLHGAISLDGGIIRPQGWENDVIEQYRYRFCFPLISFEERMRTSLLPPGCYAFERSKTLVKLSLGIKSVQNRITQRENEIKKVSELLDNLKRASKTSLLKLKTTTHHICSSMDQLQKEVMDLMGSNARIMNGETRLQGYFL